MLCKKCQSEVNERWIACPFCGKTLSQQKKKRRRANGEGTIYLRGKTYTVRVTVGWKQTDKGFAPVQVEKGGFKTQRQAQEYIPQLKAEAEERKCKAAQTHHGVDYTSITFEELYAKLMERDEKRITQDTINCYKSAHKYYADLYHLPFAALNTEDWQLCIDDCPHGTRTRENMKALGTKMYRLAAELRVFGLSTSTDFAKLVWIDKKDGESRKPFTAEELVRIKDGARRRVPYADHILAMCYTGFRPSEFLALEHDAYDPVRQTLRGGAKTDAGKNRIVPVHPIIKSFVAERYMSGSAYLFPSPSGGQMSLDLYREKCFYPALEAIGIQTVPKPGDETRPERTPYSCRHTFATLMKRVDGSARDKAALMGHTSYEMTLHYQHEDYDSLKEIVEKIA